LALPKGCNLSFGLARPNGFDQDCPGRGCDTANVAVELAESDHPVRHVIEEFKTEQRNRLARLCRDAGIAKADLLADRLWLLRSSWRAP
jgi:hypothetical protein